MDFSNLFEGPPPLNPDRVAGGVRALYSAPRDPDLARTWIRRHLPPGTLLIYGAGSFARDLSQGVLERADVSLAGFLDRRSVEIGEIDGLPVFPPDRHPDVDHILVAHTCRENDMLASLSPGDARVIVLHRDPDYHRLARTGEVVDDLGGIDCAVIHAGRSRVIPDHDLVRIFPRKRTAFFDLARAEYREESDHFSAIELRQSLSLLLRYLERYRPRVVYLATAWFNNFLFLPIRAALPDAFLIHEVFDWNLLADDAIAVSTGLEAVSLDWNLTAEYRTVHEADLIVSKRSGPFTERVNRFGTPYLCYHGGARPAEPSSRKRSSELIRVVYGGLLPTPELLATYTSDYAFLTVFENLAGTGLVEIDIFNTLDPGESEGFDLWRRRFSDRPLRYRAGLPYARFLEISRDYDFGWLASPRSKKPPLDQACLIPNRMVGYLAAGLPVIVDSGWAHAADLVTRYEAGSVVDDFSTPPLMRRLLEADRDALRRGASRLSRELAKNNNETVAAIREAVETVTSGGLC